MRHDETDAEEQGGTEEVDEEGRRGGYPNSLIRSRVGRPHQKQQGSGVRQGRGADLVTGTDVPWIAAASSVTFASTVLDRKTKRVWAAGPMSLAGPTNYGPYELWALRVLREVKAGGAQRALWTRGALRALAP